MKYSLLALLIVCTVNTYAKIPDIITAHNLIDNASFTYKMAETKKGLVIVFLSAKCPCSNSHVAILNKLSTEFKEFNFLAIHSNFDESKEITHNYFKNINLNFPVIHDVKSILANELKANKTPHVYILNKDSEILYRGGVTDSSNAANAKIIYLKNALEEIQAGKKVTLPETRVLGCVISREGDNGWD